MTVEPDPLDLVFVYGTLLPGEERWHILRPYVVDEGVADTVVGRLYDTGEGYPAATFGSPADGEGGESAGAVTGRVFKLRSDTLDEALAILDEVEDLVLGFYRRVAVTTAGGRRVWAYAYGAGLSLTPIDGGDWLEFGRG